MDGFAIALGGLRAAEQRFAKSADRIVRAPADPSVDLGQEVVEQIQAKTQFRANLGVIRVADELWRALLDIQPR